MPSTPPLRRIRKRHPVFGCGVRVIAIPRGSVLPSVQTGQLSLSTHNLINLSAHGSLTISTTNASPTATCFYSPIHRLPLCRDCLVPPSVRLPAAGTPSPYRFRRAGLEAAAFRLPRKSNHQGRLVSRSPRVWVHHWFLLIALTLLVLGRLDSSRSIELASKLLVIASNFRPLLV